MIKTYYLLTKPGIILGNAITTIGGFALASKGLIDIWLLLATLIGLGSVIASACIFNNYIDRNIDKMMSRTKNRPFVTGLVSVPKALLLACLLGIFGVFVLVQYVNLLAALIAICGFFVYVVLYSLFKSRTSYSTIIGSIAGAIPPVVGYCAVTNHVDSGAFILFFILVLWQMPHFFAIALYRFEDYIAASLPVLPIKKGIYVTKVQMLLYVIAFLIAALMLTLFGYTGYIYFWIATLLGCSWLILCIKGFTSDNDKLWARKMFVLSLVVITVQSVAMSLNTV